MLTVIAGLCCLVLAASVPPHRMIPTASAAPPAGEPRAAGIDWGAARRQAALDANDRARALAGMLDGAQGQLAKIRIPVLLPTEPGLTARLKLLASGGDYTASSSGPAMAFSLSGWGGAFPVGARTAAGARLAGGASADGVDIGKTEAGYEASFGRYGASYSLTLDCVRPDDRRCNDPAFMRSVIARLVVVIPPGVG
jgi:hypothetical protein